MAGVLGTLTKSATQKPAEMSALKFPCRALIFYLALFLFPAGLQVVFAATLVDEKEIELPLDVVWNSSPALLITVYGF